MGGISLETFRKSYVSLDAFKLINKRVEVDNETKTSIRMAGGEGDAPLTLNQLEKLPNGQARIADNIYMRGQLLTGIRDSLISLNVTGRTDCLDNEATKSFFRQAEARLFGTLQTNKKTKGKEFGVATASGDLMAQTVRDLVEALDRLTNKQKTGFKAIKAVCPDATDVQIKAVTMITDRELVKIFGLTSDEAAKATFTDFKATYDRKLGNRLTFSVSVPGRSKPFAAQVDTLGVFRSAEDYERLVGLGEKCCIYTGRDLCQKIPTEGYKSVSQMLQFALEGKEPGTKFGKNAFLKDVLLSTMVRMLPAAYVKARQFQKTGDITLATWWKALGLEGKAPKEKATAADKGNALLDALLSRTMADYAVIKGLTVKQFKADYKWYDSYERDPNWESPQNLKRKAVCQGFTSYLTDCNMDYQSRLNVQMNPEYKFTAVEKRHVALPLAMITGDWSVPTSAKLLADSIRQYGTKYSFGAELQFVQRKDAKLEEATTFLNALVEKHKFSQVQLALLVNANNDFEFALQKDFGGIQCQRKLDIKIEATGDPNRPDMRVTYSMPLLKGTENDTIVTKQNIVHTVVYTQDGDSWGEDLKLADVRAEDKTTTLEEWGKA